MIWKLLLIGAVIGSNNLAAALAMGTLGVKRIWRVLFIFGLFEFSVPLIGLWLGESISQTIGEYASAVSAMVLLGLAGLTFYAASKPPKTDRKMAQRITTIKGLILLEIGLSMDNLIAGFGIGIHPSELPGILIAAVIAIFSVCYTYFGLRFGKVLSVNWQNFAEVFAGCLLILLAALSWLEVL